MSQDINDVIIIGSGPAGYTAAIYAARAQLKPIVFEGAVTAGGALMNTTEVENFPGFPEGIMGPALMENMRSQAVKFGANLITDDVTATTLTGDVKTVVDGEGREYKAHSIILATGSSYRELGIDTKSDFPAMEFLGVQLAMASSSAIKTLLLLVAATLQLKKLLS